MDPDQGHVEDELQRFPHFGVGFVGKPDDDIRLDIEASPNRRSH